MRNILEYNKERWFSISSKNINEKNEKVIQINKNYPETSKRFKRPNKDYINTMKKIKMDLKNRE